MIVRMPRFNALTYAIGYILYTIWPTEDFHTKVAREQNKKLEIEWEAELKDMGEAL